MAVVISGDGCRRRNDMFRRLGWLEGGRGDVGVETICFDGFQSTCSYKKMSSVVAK